MSELTIAKLAAQKAGKAILKIYQSQNLNIQNKKDNSPVTAADLLSEKIIKKYLSPTNYHILSEETDDDLSRISKNKIWIVDPLDGTKDFIKRTGDFSIMIALAHQGQIELGVVYWPVKDILYFAEKGKGAFKKNKSRKIKKIKTSSIKNLAQAKILISRQHQVKSDQVFIDKYQIKNITRHGSAGLKACLVAEGKFDLYLNSSPYSKEWDIAAADIIIKEAGGVLFDLNKKQFSYNKKDVYNRHGLIFTNKFLLKKISK